MHTLTTIGWMGTKTAFLDVPENEAIAKYLAINDLDRLDGESVDTFSFDTCFHVYEAGEDRISDEAFGGKNEKTA